jgi:hypothetical protein
MRTCLLAVMLASFTAAVAAQPERAVRAARERELALVQHLRHHLQDPGDGLSLAADRRDLQRLRTSASIAPEPPVASTPATDTLTLLDRLSVIADLWWARIDTRAPFGLVRRDQLEALGRARDAIGLLQSRASRNDRDRFLPETRLEVDALAAMLAGQGELNDAAIEVALRIADQAAAGRPIFPLGPYGPGAPGNTLPYPQGATSPYGPLNAPSDGRRPERWYPPPPPGGTGGATPYELPPGYAGYAPGAGPGPDSAGTIACQTLRNSASASSSVADMLRTAECWSRLPTWPGWAIQVEESLDWAVEYARLDRDCTALGSAIDKVRELGGRLAAAGRSATIAGLAARAESDRRWLRATGACH